MALKSEKLPKICFRDSHSGSKLLTFQLCNVTKLETVKYAHICGILTGASHLKLVDL